MLLPLQSHTLPTRGLGLGRSGTPFRGSTLGFSPSQARQNRLRRWCRQTGPQRWGSAMGVGMGPDQRGQMDAGVRRTAPPQHNTLSCHWIPAPSGPRAHMGPRRAPLHPRWNRAEGGRTRSSRGATRPGTKRLHKRSVTQLPRPLLLSQQSSVPAAAPPSPRRYQPARAAGGLVSSLRWPTPGGVFGKRSWGWSGQASSQPPPGRGSHRLGGAPGRSLG